MLYTAFQHAKLIELNFSNGDSRIGCSGVYHTNLSITSSANVPFGDHSSIMAFNITLTRFIEHNDSNISNYNDVVEAIMVFVFENMVVFSVLWECVILVSVQNLCSECNSHVMCCLHFISPSLVLIIDCFTVRLPLNSRICNAYKYYISHFPNRNYHEKKESFEFHRRFFTCSILCAMCNSKIIHTANLVIWKWIHSGVHRSSRMWDGRASAHSFCTDNVLSLMGGPNRIGERHRDFYIVSHWCEQSHAFSFNLT